MVHIKETLARTVEIKAESIEDAIEKAAEIQAESKDGKEATEWKNLY